LKSPRVKTPGYDPTFALGQKTKDFGGKYASNGQFTGAEHQKKVEEGVLSVRRKHEKGGQTKNLCQKKFLISGQGNG